MRLLHARHEDAWHAARRPELVPSRPPRRAAASVAARLSSKPVLSGPKRVVVGTAALPHACAGGGAPDDGAARWTKPRIGPVLGDLARHGLARVIQLADRVRHAHRARPRAVGVVHAANPSNLRDGARNRRQHARCPMTPEAGMELCRDATAYTHAQRRRRTGLSANGPGAAAQATPGGSALLRRRGKPPGHTATRRAGVAEVGCGAPWRVASACEAPDEAARW